MNVNQFLICFNLIIFRGIFGLFKLEILQLYKYHTRYVYLYLIFQILN